jgi:hypothetical protein
MFRYVSSALAAALLLALSVPTFVSGAAAPALPPKARPKIEVVFCLDTTGSMTGLIDGAKAKIWAICNQIAGCRPTPDLKVGLVAYRDRGDEYVTKVFDLTDDLDAVHRNLKGFKAAGGGDIPESVNQALYDAVNKIKWSTDRKTLRIIFLVGDAPPHMDYPDDVKYPVTCTKACEKGILINTVQCGNDPQCTKYWKDICKRAEGSFVAIPQDGGVTVVRTPFDARLGELNAELARTTLVFGSREEQRLNRDTADDAGRLAAPAAAERVAFQAKNAQVAAFDLLDNVKQGKVKLEALKKEELPEAMREMNLKEQKDYLDKLDKRRAALNREVLDLDRKRTAFIAKQQAEDARKGKTSFDRQVIELLQRQAKKYHIAY